MLVICKKINISMDQSDIQYVLELLAEAMTYKDWEKVDEAIETLKEFLDGDNFTIGED